ncbi:MAG: hypothetical protein JWN34_5443 [Bryobacterales bacterium]|nr:hypothetical protein [Bryobacterales bacterium]
MALRTVGRAACSMMYLDGAGIPDRYRLRQVAGEPVPMVVLAAMEAHHAAPWEVRDAMLRDMGWRAQVFVRRLASERTPRKVGTS